MVGRLPAFVIPVFIALKLTGVVTWSWWWVLSPLWIAVVALALLAGGLIIAWCLGQWPGILVNLFRWRRRRPSLTFTDVSLEDPEATD